MKILDVYSQYPIALVKGNGLELIDSEGKKYIDFYSGHGVISIGHNHKLFNEAITKQLSELAFYTNAFKNPLQDELATLLGELSGYNDYQLFLSNSGAEANENAFKIASFYNGRKKVLAIKGAFHGRSAGAIAATDNPNIKPAYGNEVQADFIDMNDIDGLENKLKSRDYSAFIIEGIQGVNGVYEASESFWKASRLLCTETKTLLIADEVQSGYARSGKFFAHQYQQTVADIITVGKGIGNGFPMAGTIISPDIKLDKGMLGTTFGGGQLACAAGISVLKAIKDESLMANALQQGDFLIAEMSKIEGVKSVRGRGLMLGIEFDLPAKEIRQKLINEYGIITGFSGTDILRLLPPLSLSKEDCLYFLESLEKCIQALKN